MERAHDVAGIAAAIEHDGLAVAADVREQLHAAVVAHQDATFVLRGQGLVVTGFGNHQLMAHVAGTLPKEDLEFAGEEGFVEVGGNGELGARGRQQLAPTQVRHSYPPEKSKDGTKPHRAGASLKAGPRLEGAQGYPKCAPGGDARACRGADEDASD